MRSLLAACFQARLGFFLLLALIGASADATAAQRTLAYFTAATTQAGTLRTVNLDVSTSAAVSGLFSIAANMLPGDFQLKTIDVVNGGASGSGQQDFTYAVASTSRGAGNSCSLLDSADPPACTLPALPSASASSGAALLVVRCTADALGTHSVGCDSPGVYVRQVYPLAGVGTQRQLASGLNRSAIGGVAADGSYAIDVEGVAFTGGPVVIDSAVGLGGPDAVAGADGQTSGLLASHTDHLATLVYLPREAGPALADQTSMLTFTWTATQRLGSTR